MKRTSSKADRDTATSKFKYSVILTLFKRNPIDLAKVVQQLMKAVSDRKDVELVFGLDGREDQTWYIGHKEFLHNVEECYPHVQIHNFDTQNFVPDLYQIDGHNNPAAINNFMLACSRGRNIVWLSSDTLVQPYIFERLDKLDLSEQIWCSRVLDLDTMIEFCGPSRPTPYMWCMATARDGHPWFAEELCMGMGFDDNDWVGEALLRRKKLAIDMQHIAVHQTHPVAGQEKKRQLASGIAYTDGGKGIAINRKFIEKKWGGVPLTGGKDEALKIKYMEIGDYLVFMCDGRRDGKEHSFNVQPKASKVCREGSEATCEG